MLTLFVLPPTRCRSWVWEQHLGTPEWFPGAGASAHPDLGPKISFVPTEAPGYVLPLGSSCLYLQPLLLAVDRQYLPPQACYR